MTLVELILFMIIIGVGVAGLVSVTGALIRSSPDPMLRKQMLAVAESLLNEVLQQPFTYCDPGDPKAASAKSTADCTGGAAASQDKGGAALTSPSPEALGDRTNFNNVADYGGFSATDIGDVRGENKMIGYTASVAVERAGGDFGLSDDAAALRVIVTVQRAGQDDIQLTGYRFRYAPRI